MHLLMIEAIDFHPVCATPPANALSQRNLLNRAYIFGRHYIILISFIIPMNVTSLVKL